MNSAAAGGAQSQRHILVIKLGALGDFVLALGPCAAIRRHHPNAYITLLTMAPFVELAAASGYFDEILIDEKSPWWHPLEWLALGRQLRRSRFDRVYDLQTSDRSGWYFRLLRREPEWSGIAAGCSHRHDNPDRNRMHTLDRQAEQLSIAGIDEVPAPELTWAAADVGRFEISPPSILMAPGAAPHRPGKRWPASSYAALARALLESGYRPVLIGAAAEAETARYIVAHCDVAVDLTEQTTLLEVAALARVASAAVGNDTGAMHIAAAVGCRSVVLFSSDSDPSLTAPRGEGVSVLQRNNLADLAVDEVLATLACE